jgi:hypothetical protein
VDVSEGVVRRTGVPGRRDQLHPRKGWRDMSQLRKRTTSNDRVLERETTAKELSIGHSVVGARETLGREIALGGHCTRDGGGDGSQD